ncbi:hypothetical protein NL108_017091 [Boleophthalmus pectinirostris]|nr:hypothetical protein NL108_017091 [Boleophthalmus pectinirostris]
MSRPCSLDLQTSRGLIDLQDLEQVCREFQLETAPAVLQDLLHYCDLNGDGHIDFMEFANFLCWKDKMPIKTQEQKILTGGQTFTGLINCGVVLPERVSGSVSDGDSKPLLRPEDLEPVEPGKSLRVPRTLTRTRGDPDAFSPSSALIGAAADPKAATGEELLTVSDTTNYGDSPAAAALLRPHVHAALGVHEQDFLCPRSKQEITEIFQNVGLDLSPQLMDSVWDLAAARSPGGDVSVEDFRNVLKEINAM